MTAPAFSMPANPATATGRTTSPLMALSIVASFVRRDWATARSYRLPFVLDLFSVVVNLTLFFFLGRFIDGSDISFVSELGNGYFAFAVVGMLVVRLGQTALNSFSSKLRREQTTGTLEALLATPPPPWLVILASSAYELLYATVTALATFAVAMSFGMDIEVSLAALGALVLGVPAILAVFAALGVAVAAFTMVFKQTTSLVGMVTSAVAVLGGVYFPLEVLPRPLEMLAWALPFTWGIDLLRSALLEGQMEWGLLALLVGFSAAAIPASLAVFRVAVDRSRRTGTLSHY